MQDCILSRSDDISKLKTIRSTKNNKEKRKCEDVRNISEKEKSRNKLIKAIENVVNTSTKGILWGSYPNAYYFDRQAFNHANLINHYVKILQYKPDHYVLLIFRYNVIHAKIILFGASIGECLERFDDILDERLYGHDDRGDIVKRVPCNYTSNTRNEKRELEAAAFK